MPVSLGRLQLHLFLLGEASVASTDFDTKPKASQLTQDFGPEASNIKGHEAKVVSLVPLWLEIGTLIIPYKSPIYVASLKAVCMPTPWCSICGHWLIASALYYTCESADTDSLDSNISVLECCLACCFEVRNHHPNDQTTTHEMQPHNLWNSRVQHINPCIKNSEETPKNPFKWQHLHNVSTFRIFSWFIISFANPSPRCMCFCHVAGTWCCGKISRSGKWTKVTYICSRVAC